jgi:phage terminase large subunit
MSQRGYTSDEIKQYLEHDRYEYGVGFMPTGDRARAHTAHEDGVKWLYIPTPKGCTLHETRHMDIPNTLWGGSAGGAKSMSARWEAIAECLFSGHDSYRAIIVRRELEELRRSHLDKIEVEAKRICEAMGNDKAVKVTSQPPVATFNTTGAKIIFGHAAEDNSELKYLSEEYDLFIGDEATLLRWKQITGIQSRVRNDTKTNRRGRMILTTNPGGPSHQECVDHFIAKSVTKEKNAMYRPDAYRYIPSSLFDNVHLMDSDGSYDTYSARLWMLDGDRRQQLLDGDWGVVVNAFFPSFNPSVHVQAFK